MNYCEACGWIDPNPDASVVGRDARMVCHLVTHDPRTALTLLAQRKLREAKRRYGLQADAGRES